MEPRRRTVRAQPGRQRWPLRTAGLVTAIVLLVTGKYPPQLFALIIGANRWIYRVVAYATLMTDQYPPFRLDQGGSEPKTPKPWTPAGPAVTPLPNPSIVPTSS